MSALPRDPRRPPPRLVAAEPVPAAPAGATHASAPAGSRRLHAAGREARRDSVRVTTSFVVLVAVAFVLLNVGLYESARSRLMAERWRQLGDVTEEKREDLRAQLDELRHEAEFVANQPEVRDILAQPAAPAVEAPLSVERELDQAASSFRLLAVEVLDAHGVVRAATSNGTHWRTPAAVALARHVVNQRHTIVLTDPSDRSGPPIVVIAAPVTGDASDEPAGVGVLYVGLADRVSHSLADWMPSAPGAGAFLVARRGDDVVVASAPPPGTGLYLGQRVPLQSPDRSALVVAALGGETNIELPLQDGRRLWAVTRFVPELGCGLVGQADRAQMLAGLQTTLVGLLVLDLGVCVLALLVVLLWRRHYRARIAHQEFDLTRKHAARIQAVLDNAFDAILSLDARGRVVTANGAAGRLFLRDPDTLRGEPLEHLLRGASSHQLPGPDAAEPGRMSRTEAIRGSGAGVPVEYSLACSEHPTGRFYTLVARDISARVEAEKQIQSFAKGLEISNRRLEEANGQLEQSSRLKSEFLANTSHELRTPLNGMMGFLQLVLDGMCDSKEEERDFLTQALQCSKHLLGLINDVLDIAKIEAGRLVLQFEPIDVAAMFEEVLMVTRVQAQQKGLKLVFETPPAGAVPVRGDFGKVKQVLINLVGNSLKFTSEGSITVRAEASETAGHCLFQIVDTGIGIPKDRQSVIFEKFMQADGSTTRRYGGTGLGLAITRSLVELMGGVIGVHSDGEGKGTRMYFSLPIWRGAEELPTPSESGESLLPDLISGSAGGALVLIVDDDPVFRRFVTALLQQRGYRTAEAAHAEAGWVLVRRLRPTLVLLDYALSCPDGAVLRTGWDLAERMSHDARTRHIPYLFLTGFDAQLSERLGDVQFIHQRKCVSKPVDADTLVASVREVIGDVTNRLVRVLLADDDPTVAAYVSKVLPPDRFQVEVVNDGEECLHFLRTQPRGFDLLLLDLMMPEVSGYDVLRDLALTGTAKGLPVIVLTNEPEARNESERRLLEHGIVLDVLSKTRVHEHPALLPETIEHHLKIVYQDLDALDAPPLEVERFRAEVPEGDAADAAALGVERFSGPEPAAENAPTPASEPITGAVDEDQRRAA